MLDVQNDPENRGIPLFQAGIRSVKHPIIFTDRTGTISASVGDFALSVSVPHNQRGTHMSRFLDCLYRFAPHLSFEQMELFSADVKEKLCSDQAHLRMAFSFFYKKQAPISKIEGILDVDVVLNVQNGPKGFSHHLSVATPIKSLCPCSKAISRYGAHSQRGIVTVQVWDSMLSILDLVSIADNAASCPVYPILKRQDEQFVTERAYDNPRFVEDVAREAALQLQGRADQFEVSVENLESIHNHNAWACIRSSDLVS